METSLTLLERARAQDLEAQNRIALLYSALIYSWCRKDGLRPDDADDVGQEVIFSAINRLNQFSREKPGASFRKWLRSIARNRVLDWKKSAERRMDAPGGSENFGLIAAICDEDAAEVVDTFDNEAENVYAAALKLLKNQMPEVVWYILWEVRAMGRPFSEVAAELGISENAARLKASRMEREIRREFDGLL